MACDASGGDVDEGNGAEDVENDSSVETDTLVICCGVTLQNMSYLQKVTISISGLFICYLIFFIFEVSFFSLSLSPLSLSSVDTSNAPQQLLTTL